MRLAALLLLLSCAAAAAQAPPGDPEASFLEAQDLLLEKRYTEARTLLQEAQETWRLRGDRYREALCWPLLGMAEVGRANYTAAVASYAEAARTLEALGDRFGAWAGLYLLASLETRQERSSDAVAHNRQALALLRELAASREPLPVTTVGVISRLFPLPEAPDAVLLETAELLSRDSLVEALLNVPAPTEVEAELPRLAELSRRLGGNFDAKVTLNEARLRELQGRQDEARWLFRLALERTTPTPDAPLRTRGHEMDILSFLVMMEILSGRPEEALPWTDRALALARERGELHDLAKALRLRAEALEKCDRREEAETALSEALDLMRQTGNLSWQAQIYQRLGQFALRADRFEKAVLHLETAVGLFRAIDVPSEEARTWRLLALAYMHLESRENAGMARQKAHELAKKSGTPRDLAMANFLDIGYEFPDSPSGARDAAQSLAAVLEFPEAQYLPGNRIEDIRGLITLQTLPDSGDIPTGLSRIVMSAEYFHRGDFAAARVQALQALEEAGTLA